MAVLTNISAACSRACPVRLDHVIFSFIESPLIQFQGLFADLFVQTGLRLP